MLFSSARAFRGFKRSLENGLCSNSTALGSNSTTLDRDPTYIAYQVLFAIYQQINEESIGFVNELFDRANDIVGSLYM